MVPADLAARVLELRRQVRHIKSAIRVRTHELHAVAAELRIREEECRAYGIPVAPDSPHA